MSFFDFFNRNSNEQPAAPSNDEAPVVIFVEPGNEVEIPASEACSSSTPKPSASMPIRSSASPLPAR
jgi:hypothetical protein